MTNKEIVGGVSPLKKKARQSSRGGTEAGKATRTSKQRGGFAKSKGARGAGGANVGGYNVQTSFKPGAAWNKPGSGGTTTPNPKKPYSYTPDGELTMNPGYKLWVDPVEGTEDRTETTDELIESKSGEKITKASDFNKRLTLQEAWDNNLENIKDKYPDFSAYKADRDAQNTEGKKGATEKEIYDSIHKTTSKFIKGTKGKPGYWQHYDKNGNMTHRTYEKNK